MNNMQNACYECKYIGDIPGSAHHSCNHPIFKAEQDDPMLNLLSILGGVGRVPSFQIRKENCYVVGNQHGIKNGWFIYPFNFDPTWLEICTGFEPKDNKDEKAAEFKKISEKQKKLYLWKKY